MQIDYHWAPWCKFCSLAGPAIQKVADAHPEVDLVKINADEHKYSDVQGLPTVILRDDDGNEIRRVVGAKSHRIYEQELFQ
jgi:thioredoxin-like negative regulator of GroEL